eukprot:8096256-Heterocapsa_arctica.AAC.1
MVAAVCAARRLSRKTVQNATSSAKVLSTNGKGSVAGSEKTLAPASASQSTPAARRATATS